VTVHRYRAACSWAGSTAVGYERYERTHTVRCPPASAALELSGDAAFLGDPSRLNPEQLLVAAAASCQLLSFLAVAARARVDVLAYEDDAEAEMPEDDPPTRITAIHLRPRITVAAGTNLDKVRRLVGLAHDECYVAGSLTTAIDIEAEILHDT
jgi:organic hydroperoxide reductase OsmC/OhrA